MFVDPLGLAWTQEDEDVQRQLFDAGMDGIALSLRYEVDSATTMYNEANGDKGAMNLARLSAVKARTAAYGAIGKKYVDDYDYTYGQGMMAFIGVHSVAMGQYHASVIVVVSKNSPLYNNEGFINSFGGGSFRYATLGAGPVSGELESGINRPKDVMLDIKRELIAMDTDNVQTINNLFSANTKYANYQMANPVDYDFIPNDLNNGYNSNSYAHGLLNAVGFYIPRNPKYSVPGWDKPLPKYMFGQ